jgi:hypothetical protein
VAMRNSPRTISMTYMPNCAVLLSRYSSADAQTPLIWSFGWRTRPGSRPHPSPADANESAPQCMITPGTFGSDRIHWSSRRRANRAVVTGEHGVWQSRSSVSAARPHTFVPSLADNDHRAVLDEKFGRGGWQPRR